MDLQEVRKSINEIDDSMKKLFDKRLECSKNVAKVKLKHSDDVYKPAREKEICERFSNDEDVWYLPFIKKVMQISRKYQYRQFIRKDHTDSAFVESLSEEQRNTLLHGGEFCITLRTDENSCQGLCLKDIISVIADSKLTLLELEADGEQYIVYVRLHVGEAEEERLEAFTLAYMLFKETIQEGK